MNARTLIAATIALAGIPLASVAQQPFPLEPGGTSAHGDSATSFDGTNFLVFFEDDRGIPGNRELYGMLVSPAGTPQSPLAFMVSSGPYTGYPDACYGGGQHFVVYEGAWGGGAVPQIIATRVLPDGTVMDPNGIAVWNNQQTGRALRPQAASNGQKYCVVWGDDLLYPGEMPLQFAIVRFDGTVEIGPVNIPGSDLASPLTMDLASDGTNFVLAWEGGSGLMATRISPAGAVLGTSLVQASSSYWLLQPKIGFSGGSFLVSWYWRPGGVDTLSARRFSTTGAPLGSLINLPSPGVPYAVLGSASDFLVFRSGVDQGPGALPQLQYTPISAAGIVGQTTGYLDLREPGMAGMPSVAIGTGGTVLSAVSLATSQFEPSRMIGQILEFGLPACYANCDGSSVAPVLNVSDFVCFQTRYAAQDPYANCDGSTLPPVLNVSDFVCFQSRFAAGCS